MVRPEGVAAMRSHRGRESPERGCGGDHSVSRTITGDMDAGHQVRADIRAQAGVK